jgi:Uma2 family endonuclease
MSAAARPSSSPLPARPAIPPLRNGDRLTRDEFERRYHAMPWVKKAELIEGIVYMPSPVSQEDHGKPRFNAITCLGLYCVYTPGVVGGDNATIKLDLDNEPQPDACLYVEPRLGGRVKIDEDGYIVGAPEFVVEISASSTSIDLHQKLNAYRRNGVLEYVVWRTYDGAIDFFVLRGGDYVRKEPDSAGILHSEVLPGLWLDPAALMAGDMLAVMKAIQAGVATPDHAAFVADLARRGSRQS